MNTKQNITNCIAVTGGGTGGHILPLIAVLEELNKKWNGKIIWIGSKSDMEKRLIKTVKVKYYGIPAGKLRRYFSIKNIIDIVRIISGIIVSFFILLKNKPSLLFSKGGYVSVPPVLAAYFLKIPVFTHESDVDPGLATKINSNFSKKIFVSFPETIDYFKDSLKHKIVVTGNPVRASILKGIPSMGREFINCTEDKKLLLILGGSQGAKKINELIYEIKDKLGERYCVLHQTGFKSYKNISIKSYKTVKYLKEELPHILSASSLVLSRAGANTLWELAACHKPSILIPLPLTSSRGDQIRNAEIFKKAGASLVLQQEDLNSSKLLEIITKLLDNKKKLTIMGENAGKIFRSDSAVKIAEMIINVVQPAEQLEEGN